jgi:predicted acyltransferase
MELAETPGTLDAVALPLPAATVVAKTAAARIPRPRLISLDAMRGFTVLGMIVVNTLTFTRTSYGYRPDFAFLAHSAWAGFTFADFVFPAFIFIAGFSVAFSFQHRTILDWQLGRRIAGRTAALFAIGFLLTNIDWFGHMDEGSWRLLGVLQRIALCYCATAVLLVTCGMRTRLVVAALVLLLYWPLTLIPFSHQATLTIPGANFVSWFDREILGSHILAGGPHGYDPEGLLSTLPAMAQCLLGAAAGQWLLKNRDKANAPLKLVMAGVALAALGLAWSPIFPIVKNIWTSSFVLFSTGLALILFALCYWALDRKHFRSPAITFLEAFGLNALLAYVLQELAGLFPAANGDMHAIGAASLKSDLPALMANLPVLAFIVVLWFPLEYLRRRRWIVKI